MSALPMMHDAESGAAAVLQRPRWAANEGGVHLKKLSS